MLKPCFKVTLIFLDENEAKSAELPHGKPLTNKTVMASGA